VIEAMKTTEDGLTLRSSHATLAWLEDDMPESSCPDVVGASAAMWSVRWAARRSSVCDVLKAVYCSANSAEAAKRAEAGMQEGDATDDATEAAAKAAAWATADRIIDAVLSALEKECGREMGRE
jgi:hypothetical protein